MYKYEYLDKLLVQNHLRASEVADSIGISRSAISDWKKGRYTPKIDKLQKIANFFGVSVEYFSTGKTEAEILEESHIKSLNSMQTELAIRDVLESSALFTDVEFTREDIQDIIKYVGYVASQKDGD